MKDKEKDICSIFEKGLKTLKAYTKNSNFYKNTIEEIKKEIRDNFDSFIKLELMDNFVLQNGVPLYKKSKKEENIFFPLYRDGMRKIEIDPKIPEDEIEKFIDVLNFDILKTKEEMDTVGYFWLKDLKFVFYNAIDGISEGVEGGEKGDEFSKAVEDLLKSIKEKPSKYIDKDTKYKMIIEKDVELNKLYVENKETEKIPLEKNNVIFELKDDEFERIKELVLKLEDEKDIIFKFIKILLYILKNKKYEDVEDIKFYFEKLGMAFLDSKDFSNYFWILEEIEKLKEKNIFENMILLLNEKNIKEIINNCNKEKFFSYFISILISYFPDILLKYSNYISSEMILKEFEKKPQIIDLYLNEDEKAFFILNILKPELLFIYFDKVKNFLKSENLKLKEKTIEILIPYIKHIGIKEFMQFIGIQNQNIRIKLLKAIENEDLRHYVKHFINLIEKKNFNNLSSFEKKLIFKVILRNGNKDDIEKINLILPKRKIFLRKKDKKIAFEAAKILAQFEEGKRFLKENEKFWKKYLKGE